MTKPKRTDPLTVDEMTQAADRFFPLFDIVLDRMPEGSKTEDCLKVMESLAKLGHKIRAERIEKEVKMKFGFNKGDADDNDPPSTPDYVHLEMQMADLMAQQEASRVQV